MENLAMSSPIEEYIEYEVLEGDSYGDCLVTNEDDKFLECDTVSNDLDDVAVDNSIIQKDNGETEFFGCAALNSDYEIYMEADGSGLENECKYPIINDYVDENKLGNCKVCAEDAQESANKSKKKVISCKPKKRTRNPEIWKQNIRKKMREKGLPYINSSGVEMPGKSMRPPCTSNCINSCTKKISREERQRIHDGFWNLNYQEKHIYYRNFIKQTQIKRRRIDCSNEMNPKKKHSYKYYFNVNNRSIQVCKKYFLNTLAVSAGAISTFLANNYDKDISKLSNRGKKRKSSELQMHKEHAGDSIVHEEDVHKSFVKADVASYTGANYLLKKTEVETEFVSCLAVNSDFETYSMEIEGIGCDPAIEIELKSSEIDEREERAFRHANEIALNCLETDEEHSCEAAIEINIDEATSKTKQKSKTIREKIRDKGLPHTYKYGVEMPKNSMGPLCTSNCFYSCAKKISSKNRQRIHDDFWKLSYEEKHTFYSNSIQLTEINRKGAHCNKENNPRRQNSFQYFFNVKNHTIQVCKKYFLSTLAVSAGAINHFLAKHSEKDTLQMFPTLLKPKRKGPELDGYEALEGNTYSDGLLIEAGNGNKYVGYLTPNSATENVAGDHFAGSSIEDESGSSFDGGTFTDNVHKVDFLETYEETAHDSANKTNCTSESLSSKPKMRTRNPETWKQNIRKNRRQKGLPYINSNGVEMPGKSLGPTCAANCINSCTKNISSKKRQRIHEDFWKLTTEEKYEFYCNFIKRAEIKRRRLHCSKETDPKRKNSYKYYFNVNNRTIRVCKIYFLNTLAISAGAVHNFFANQAHKSSIKVSNRGRKGYSQARIEEVKNHIRSFPTVKTVKTSSKREYLEEHLNVTKMFNLYREISADPVGVQTYRNIFNTCFNYAFYDPKKDTHD